MGKGWVGREECEDMQVVGEKLNFSNKSCFIYD